MIHKWNNQQKDFTNRKSIQLPEGGKEPIERICTAYGFTSRLSLCKHLNVSQSTMANRVARGNFPSDWILICAMETGASLNWLVYGLGDAPNWTNKMERTETPEAKENIHLDYVKIQNGVIHSTKQLTISSELIPVNAISPRLISYDSLIWIIDDFSGELVDGFWLIKMDDVVSVREIYRLPGGRIRIENGKASFDCEKTDVEVLGKVIGKTVFEE